MDGEQDLSMSQWKRSLSSRLPLHSSALCMGAFACLAMPCLLAQLQEAHLLAASTSNDEFRWRPSEDGDQEAWQAALERVGQGDNGAGWSVGIPPLALALRLNELLWLHVQYSNVSEDDKSLPTMTLYGPRVLPDTVKQLAAHLDRIAADAVAQEQEHVVFAVYTELQAYMAENDIARDTCADDEKTENEESSIATLQTIDMLRVVFWTHHLKAPSKKRDMTHWCAELDLFGLVKSGYPGFLCFEGAAEGVRDIVRRIKALQWHAITVKTEVPYTYALPEPMTVAAAHDAALRRCLLATGHSAMQAYSQASALDAHAKLRTTMDEVTTSRELVERLREARVPQDEVKYALNLRN